MNKKLLVAALAACTISLFGCGKSNDSDTTEYVEVVPINTIQATTEIIVINDDTTTEVCEDRHFVFNPITHYVHYSDCIYADNECRKIEDTEFIKCKRCPECNPDIEIVMLYED